MGFTQRQKDVREYRGQIPSPGRPTVAWREDRVRFWAAIKAGVSSEAAAAGLGSLVRPTKVWAAASSADGGRSVSGGRGGRVGAVPAAASRLAGAVRGSPVR